MFPPATTPEQLDEQRGSRSPRTAWRWCSCTARARAGHGRTPSGTAEPADHGEHPVHVQRAGRRLGAAADGRGPDGHDRARHPRQLRGRDDPVGTVLSGEENFNGYFRTAGTSAADLRYGLADKATSRGWESVDRGSTRGRPATRTSRTGSGGSSRSTRSTRTAPPVKHTALGRFKHEGANRHRRTATRWPTWATTSGSTTCTSSSRRTPPPGREPARPPAQQDAARQGLPLRRAVLRRLPGRGDHQDRGAALGRGLRRHRGVAPDPGRRGQPGPRVQHRQALVNARLAADASAPRRWTGARTSNRARPPGACTWPCTNNTDRGKAGKEGRPSRTRGTPTGTGTSWRSPRRATPLDDLPVELLLVCGDPATNTSTYFAGFPADQVSPISCPDNVTFDSAGNLGSPPTAPRASSGTTTGCSRCR